MYIGSHVHEYLVTILQYKSYVNLFLFVRVDATIPSQQFFSPVRQFSGLNQY